MMNIDALYQLICLLTSRSSQVFRDHRRSIKRYIATMVRYSAQKLVCDYVALLMHIIKV